MAVVLVGCRELAEPHASALIHQLRDDLGLPVMLVARDNEAWVGARARADFDPEPYLYALLGMRDIDWTCLPRDCHHMEGA